MHARYEHNGLTWVDLESPTRDEVQEVMNEFGIVPLVAEELLHSSTKPRVDFYNGYAYLVLHFPALRHSQRMREQEIDFVVGKEFIVTTHYDSIDPLHKFSKVFEVNSILDKSNIGDHAGFLFFYMVRKLYRSVEHETEFVRNELAAIEDHIFGGEENRMVHAISRSARDLLNLRQTIEPHREVWHSFEVGGTRLFGEDFAPYLRALESEYFRVHNHVMRETDSLHELRETNNSLLSTKENEAMRVLTILAFLTFPLSLLVGILEFPSPSNPIRGLPYDFWIVVAIVTVVGACMVTYFKHKKWL